MSFTAIDPTLAAVFPDFMRGDTYNRNIPFTTSSGAFDFTPWTTGGWALSMKMRKGGSDGTSIGTVTLALVGAATLGVLNVLVTSTVAAAVDSTRLYFDLQSANGGTGEVQTILSGVILVNKDATH